MNREQINAMRRQARRDDQHRKDAILAEVARRVEQAAAAHPDLVDPAKRSPAPADLTTRTSPYDGLTPTDMDRLFYGT